MIEYLNDTLYPIEQRFKWALDMLNLQDEHIQKLKAKLEKIESDQAWKDDQTSEKRMGL